MGCMGTTATRGDKEPVASDILIPHTELHCSTDYAIIYMVLLKKNGKTISFFIYDLVLSIYLLFFVILKFWKFSVSEKYIFDIFRENKHFRNFTSHFRCNNLCLYGAPLILSILKKYEYNFSIVSFSYERCFPLYSITTDPLLEHLCIALAGSTVRSTSSQY